MNDHTQIEELLAADALGGLTSDERITLEREMASHGPACQECERLEAEFSEVAGRMAFSLAPASVDPSIVGQILQTPPVQATSETLAPSRSADRRGWRMALLAAAAVVLLVIGGIGGAILNGGGSAQRDLALSDFVTDPDTTIAHFESTDGGRLAVATQAGTGEVYVIGDSLPEPGDGKAYQLWTITGEQSPVPGPTFVPDSGSIAERFSLPTAGSDVMAVTIEPAGGSKQPTSDPVYVAKLS